MDGMAREAYDSLSDIYEKIRHIAQTQGHFKLLPHGSFGAGKEANMCTRGSDLDLKAFVTEGTTAEEVIKSLQDIAEQTGGKFVCSGYFDNSAKIVYHNGYVDLTLLHSCGEMRTLEPLMQPPPPGLELPNTTVLWQPVQRLVYPGFPLSKKPNPNILDFDDTACDALKDMMQALGACRMMKSFFQLLKLLGKRKVIPKISSAVLVPCICAAMNKIASNDIDHDDMYILRSGVAGMLNYMRSLTDGPGNNQYSWHDLNDGSNGDFKADLSVPTAFQREMLARAMPGLVRFTYELGIIKQSSFGYKTVQSIYSVVYLLLVCDLLTYTNSGKIIKDMWNSCGCDNDAKWRMIVHDPIILRTITEFYQYMYDLSQTKIISNSAQHKDMKFDVKRYVEYIAALPPKSA